MEDFGYQKDGENEKFSGVVRKVFLVGGAMISLALFVYITVNAYYFVYYDKNSDVEVIKSPEGVIKEMVESEVVDGEGAAQTHAIYQDIFGNGRESDDKNAKIRKAPEPAIPGKNVEPDRRLLKGALPPADQKKVEVSVEPSQAANTAAPMQNITTEKVKSDQVVNDQTSATATKKNRRQPLRVQIAAMTSKEAAKDYWQKISNTNSNIFSGLKPFVEQVDLGKRGVFFRLQIGNFFNQTDAEEFCARYVAQTKKGRADCIIVE